MGNLEASNQPQNLKCVYIFTCHIELSVPLFCNIDITPSTHFIIFHTLVFSTEHTLGHIFAITTSINNGTFNEDVCISSGFMLAEFICGQGMIVTITALSGNIHHKVVTKVDVPTILYFK